MQRRADFVDRKVQVFKEEQETWKEDADKAMAFFELEELIRDGVELYDDICRVDEQWHLSVYENPEQFDQGFTDRLFGIFNKWFQVTGQLVGVFKEMQVEYAARGFDLGRFARLSASYKQCEAILNPAVVSVECVEFAEVALELHRAGKTEGMDEVCSH